MSVAVDRLPAGSAAGSCVFCTRIDQPAVLFETASLYAMPDKFPTRPGHILIIAKAHLPCYAAAPELLEELEAAKARVQRFVCESYGGATLVLEHGVAGQSVFHAHLHVVPGPPVALPDAYRAHPDVRRIGGWAPVCERYAACGRYRLVEYGGVRYLLDGDSPSLALTRPWCARFTGMRWDPTAGWIKHTTPTDVRETKRRWAAWVRAG
jgi:diadenosine tetraphosphate (Ap4A) HIT family hydrolase